MKKRIALCLLIVSSLILSSCTEPNRNQDMAQSKEVATEKTTTATECYGIDATECFGIEIIETIPTEVKDKIESEDNSPTQEYTTNENETERGKDVASGMENHYNAENQEVNANENSIPENETTETTESSQEMEPNDSAQDTTNDSETER